MPARGQPRVYNAVVWALGIALLVAAAGCGGDEKRGVAGRGMCGTPGSDFSEPTTRLTYRGATRLDRDIPVVCERLAALEIRHRARREGRDRIVIEVPSDRVAAVGVSELQDVARTGRLSFYDWEANVVGPDGRPSPDDASVTGGPAAGQVGALSLFDAIARAGGRNADRDGDNARPGSVFYAVEPKARRVYGDGARTRAAALADAPPPARERVEIREVKEGTVLLRAEQAADVKSKPNRWFVLRDDVGLEGDEIRSPKQRFDEGPAGVGTPVVTFEFTPKGRKIWRDVTRTIARRGARAVGSLPGQDPSANQHFAIVLDDEIVTVPFIDARENPDGVDPRRGLQIGGGFTVASARQLATLLRSGALAVALELVAVTPSG
ncbi:MAG: SecDF P1 head subdomain-containing protein [Solirubrobacteraceae bacterium]